MPACYDVVEFAFAAVILVFTALLSWPYIFRSAVWLRPRLVTAARLSWPYLREFHQALCESNEPELIEPTYSDIEDEVSDGETLVEAKSLPANKGDNDGEKASSMVLSIHTT